MKTVGMLNESNENFLDYLSSDFANEILSKNKMKIHLESGNIYYNNLNIRVSIYDFMIAQQDETKKIIDFELDIDDDFEFYLNEVINGTTDDKFDIDTNSTSKFLLYHFNNLRRDFGEVAYKIRHTIISNDLHALEKLQSTNWPYFIDRLLEISKRNITELNLFNFEQNQNNREQLRIINDTIGNLKTCKSYYADIYANIGCIFQNYLLNAPDVLIKKIQNDIRLNLFSGIDLKTKQNPSEILKVFDRIFFLYGSFAAINELTVVPTGDVPDFVKSKDVISSLELYDKFSSGSSRGLAYLYFLAALNIHLGGKKLISKNAMSEFYHNLSMQALSKSNDEVFFKFDPINCLNKNLNKLMIGKIRAFEMAKVSTMMLEDFDRLIFVKLEKAHNEKLRKILSMIL